MQPHAGRRFRVALVGAGRWGANYLRALPAIPDLELVAVCDSDSAARDRARSGSLAVVPHVRDLARLGLDGVVVAVPSADHAERALECLDLGAHVLVEKPLATSLGGARAILSRARDVGRRVVVGHITVHHPGLAAARAAVENGVVGTIKRIHMRRTSNGARHQRDSALWALGPHDIANLLFLTRPAELRVRKAVSEGSDAARAELLADGVPVRMEWSRLATEPERRLLIEGEKGAITFDERTEQVELVAGERSVSLHSGGSPVPLLERQCSRFAAAMLEGGSEAPADALEVVRVLATLQSMIERGAHRRSPRAVNEAPPSGT